MGLPPKNNSVNALLPLFSGGALQARTFGKSLISITLPVHLVTAEYRVMAHPYFTITNQTYFAITNQTYFAVVAS